MSRRERGFFEPGFVTVMILLLVPSLVLIKTLHGIRAKQKARDGAIVAAPLDLASPLPTVRAVFTENPPPTVYPECVKRALESYPGLSWNGTSWVDAKDPPPPARSADLPEWRGRMSAKVGGLTDLFVRLGCNQPPPAPTDLAKPKSPTDNQRADWTGRWYLVKRASEIHRFNLADCRFPAYVDISLQSSSEGNFNFEGRPQMVGQISSFTFRVGEGTDFQAVGTMGYEEGQNVLSGDLAINWNAAATGSRCQWFYSARKTPPKP